MSMSELARHSPQLDIRMSNVDASASFTHLRQRTIANNKSVGGTGLFILLNCSTLDVSLEDYFLVGVYSTGVVTDLKLAWTYFRMAVFDVT
ncbi:hypothetical protein DPMN_052228 [Dreissena polymorpha]|uniref:Uncharacterized protein n=1 Tax=Dreissena polymorpha TaxID=45954 RepID=A0A9D4CLJ2_DREPO|nr:hypothetical protein DPMN_052228 [Dreissena polymorpha]